MLSNGIVKSFLCLYSAEKKQTKFDNNNQLIKMKFGTVYLTAGRRNNESVK